MNEEGEVKLEMATFSYACMSEPDIDEFICPFKEGCDSYPYVTIAYCEDKARHNGCESKSVCEAYAKQKLLQEKFKELDWERSWLIPEQERAKIDLIRKGAIINA